MNIEFLTAKRDGSIPENYEQVCFQGGFAYTCFIDTMSTGERCLAECLKSIDCTDRCLN